MTVKAIVWFKRFGTESGKHLGAKDLLRRPERLAQAQFEHGGKIIVARIAGVDPPDWESRGVTPTVYIEESEPL